MSDERRAHQCHLARFDVGLFRRSRHHRVVNKIGQFIELPRPAKNIDMGKLAEDVHAIPLGHAADDADHDVRLVHLAVFQFAEPRPDFVLGVLADGAGVVEDDIRLLAIFDRFVPLGAELTQDELGIEHVHLAAEGFHVQLASHGSGEL